MGEALAVRLPRQARTRAAWQRILEAGVQIVERDGYDALTIASLCDRAGVTPPTIYARAGSKEALMLAIYEHAMERIRRSDSLDPKDTRWRELPADLVIPEAVTALARIWLGNARLLRALINRAGKDPETFRRGSENSIDLARRFTAILLLRPDLIRGPDAELRADTCFRVVYAALVQRVVFGAGFESDRSLPDEDLQTLLIQMVQRFLTTEEGL